MTRTLRLLALLLVVGLTGCTSEDPGASPDKSPNEQSTPTPGVSGSPSASPSPAPAPSPTEIALEPPGSLAAPGVLKVGAEGTVLASAPGGSSAGRIKAGVLLPFSAVQNGWARVTTPCELTRWMPVEAGSRVVRPAVVLDPGHGGDEAGATGPTGLLEKEVNLDVASRAAGLLNSLGIPAMLTRTSDYRASLPFRVQVADNSAAELMVSIHHNADPDGPLDRPGSETYYQFRSAGSKRLAGLVYEETVAELSKLGAGWVGDTDAGAKWRLNSSGGDYYGILRRSGEVGVVTTLAELAFVSNPAEEALLRREDVRQMEASAIVRAVQRYLGSKDPGSGFTTPYPRTAPAGPGGGTKGCVDPS
ncbi:MAG TPA: N-acetylmuramoyl-L-alanine amidase [Actinomycetota bacterium]|nr:N-acetylmuramoyl-L-alanine amidase [Actinomycetota bacterium]